MAISNNVILLTLSLYGYSFCFIYSISKLALMQSSGYFKALKNNGDPEKDNGEIGPTVMNGYSFFLFGERDSHPNLPVKYRLFWR